MSDRAFEWDDTIKEESSYTLLDEGDYDFRVEKYERARHAGSAKLPPCNKAVLTLNIIKDGVKLTDLQHNLFLHSSVEGLLSAFFLSIGLKKHGEPLVMNFNAVPGTVGKCHIIIDTYTKNDGSQGKNNKVKYFIDPEISKPASGASVVPSDPSQQTMSGYNKPVNWGAR